MKTVRQTTKPFTPVPFGDATASTAGRPASRRRWAVFALALLPLAACSDPAVLEPSKLSLDFGTVLIGEAKDLTVTWTNTGKTAAVVQSYKADKTKEFAVVKPTTPDTVQPGKSTKTVTVRFVPAKKGTVTGTAVPVPKSAAAKANPVQLKGTGVFQIPNLGFVIGGSKLTLGKPLDFGKVVVPDGTADRKISIINAQSKTITVKVSITGGNDVFALAPGQAATVTIKPLQKKRITLRFKPGKIGVFPGAVRFEDTADATSVSGTSLRGEGVKKQVAEDPKNGEKDQEKKQQ